MSAEPIDPGTRIGAVVLRVADLEGVAGFYRDAIGLVEAGKGQSAEGKEVIRLAAPGDDRSLVVLIGDPDAPARPARTTGLFHLAILVPSRLELSRSLARLSRSGRRLTGASDHLVSEALYLNDPEGNGIEIYRDRPRAEWRQRDGELAMATLPLDLQSVLAEIGDEDPGDRVAAGTVIGHVHLNIGSIPESDRFYVEGLGLEATVRAYPGALFVAAGGYHHHIGLNTWNGEGAPAPPSGALGLDHFELLVPDRAEIVATVKRLVAAGIVAAPGDEGAITGSSSLALRDPSGIAIRLAIE